MTGRAYVGTSGWLYPPWRGVFYPKGLPHREELRYMSGKVNSVEINGSFYSLQRPESWVSWRQETPADFLFAVKGPRFVTHLKQLREVRTPVANFFASGVLALGPKLGPVLWQLPPRMRFVPDRMRAFLELLPHSTAAAAELAKEHDERLEGRSLFETDTDRPLRHAVEVRHESFRDPAFLDLLRRHNVALVVADTAGKYLALEDVTADFVYIRLHGEHELYASGYEDDSLQRWADKIRAWAENGDVYCYFDNDIKVRAPFDALRLMEMLDIEYAVPS
jgi:uncharacterized protein YecE (DUF72 family)